MPGASPDVSRGFAVTLQPRGSGLAAEGLACRHLEDEGFSIEARNYRSGAGEIDIVARKENLLLFVEVRFREDVVFGTPEDTVDKRKRLRVAAAARDYLTDAPPGSWDEARFDVIVIEGTGGQSLLRHYPAAFDARGKVL